MSVRDLARAHVAALGHQQRPSCPNGTALEVSQRDKRPISPQYQKDKLSHDVGTAGQLRPGGTLRQAGTNRTLGTDGTLGQRGRLSASTLPTMPSAPRSWKRMPDAVRMG